MKFFKNELMISHRNTKLNICQNVGPNELCIVFMLSFFFSVSLCVCVSLYRQKKEEERRKRREESKNNKRRILHNIG